MVGNSGSGKTTLARRLAQQLGYRHIELDALYHQPNWQALPRELFQQQVSQALQQTPWVVEGNYSAVRPTILAQSDTVIWLDLPRSAVMRQLIPRTLKRLFSRKPLWNGNRERWTNLFSLKAEQSILVWAWQRHSLYRQRYSQEMQHAKAINYIRLTSRREVEDWLLSLTPQ